MERDSTRMKTTSASTEKVSKLYVAVKIVRKNSPGGTRKRMPVKTAHAASASPSSIFFLTRRKRRPRIARILITVRIFSEPL